MKKVAIFASGRGSNFEHIIKSQIPCMSIEVLVTDKICNALSIANHYHIESRTFLRKNYETKKSDGRGYRIITYRKRDRPHHISWVHAFYFLLGLSMHFQIESSTFIHLFFLITKGNML